jgi:hypothetical protein
MRSSDANPAYRGWVQAARGECRGG